MDALISVFEQDNNVLGFIKHIITVSVSVWKINENVTKTEPAIYNLAICTVYTVYFSYESSCKIRSHLGHS